MSVLKSLSLLRSARVFAKNQIQFNAGCRNLFSAPAMGIDGFEHNKNKIKMQLNNIEAKFKTKMSEYVTEGSKNIIFTEDLKNMVHIATSEDIDLVIKMMKRFNSQNKELRFGNFIFGPVVMRMFHLLNKPNEAVECFKSPELDGFFDQLITHQILFDLLYENQMYKEILELYEYVKSRQVGTIRWARNLIVLVMAACYRLNSEASLNYALKLWFDINDTAHLPARRAVTYCAALALNQNRPEVCLEILSSITNQSYTTVRNLKALAFIKLLRSEDIISLLKSILNEDNIQTFNKDVLESVNEYFEKENNPELMNEFNQIMKYYKEHGNISDVTLDQQLISEIQQAKKVDPTKPFRAYDRFGKRIESANQNRQFRRTSTSPFDNE